MNTKMGIILAIAGLGVSVNAHAIKIPAAPDQPLRAQTALGFNLQTRCPELHVTDFGERTVLFFWVPRRGSQSEISIRTSSGSDELDSAAMSCVAKLRFAPSTTLGDGESIDSWQQIALGWADPAKTRTGREVGGQNLASRVIRAAPVAAAPTARLPVSAGLDETGAQGHSATVHVCVDEDGKVIQEPVIVQSSGVSSVDQAAVKIAAAGSPYYRPGMAGKPSSSGCAQLTVDFNAK